MRAVILVGGFGTRLRPLTLTTPKQMLPVADVPQLERKIAHLVKHGVDDIVLSMGYKPDAFRDAYPNNECAGAKLHYIVESKPLGTAGAVAFAAREAGIKETFLAMNGDTLTDLDVASLLELHRQSNAEGTIALTPVEDPSRFGVVITDDGGQVEAFIEKPKREEAPTNLINAGTYVLEPSFMGRVLEDTEVSIEREIFPKIVSEGGLFAGSFNHYWLDIGTPEAYLQGNLDVLDQDYQGESYIGKTAAVAVDATVKRSVVGRGASIGSGAELDHAVVLPGAVIEPGAKITRSIVGDRAHVGADAELSDLTVVGADLSIPAATRLSGEKVSPPES
jgi:mannose-1-phosphate guanylyltransferase